jgi:N-formylglutamate amidohydrolase
MLAVVHADVHERRAGGVGTAPDTTATPPSPDSLVTGGAWFLHHRDGMTEREVFAITEGAGPIIATAIHDGHALRAEVAERIALDPATRLREEDPYTGRLTAVAPTRLIALRSRFEVDLNRPRDGAVYRVCADAWGLEVWNAECPSDLAARSLAQYDRFYAELERVLRERERRHGRFVVLDLHSYNHRRGGPDAPPADPAGHPEINLGTGSVDRGRWGALIDRFRADLAAAPVRGRPLDVRENVIFEGGEMARWIHRTFPTSGCALAIELKKTFMDEWTGRVDEAHLAELGRALATTLPGLLGSLGA